jgi:hypothetical protein
MRQCRRHTGPAGWLALFAILFQALLPVVHHPAGVALAGAINPDSHNFCFAPGTGDHQPADPHKAPANHTPPCPICQAMHAVGGFVPAAAPSPVVTGNFEIADLFPQLESSGRSQPRETAQARAPPVKI